MHLLLYIQVKANEDIQFGNPYSDLTNPDENLMLLDADNHSEDLVINHQIQMIEEATRVILILDVNHDIAPGSIVRLLEKLFRKKNSHVSIFLNGENAIIANMLKLTTGEIHSQLDQQSLKAAIEGLVSSH
ncbi:MAG: hypothetical protein HEP71_29995 [Roseivirga sp.]|nr:hypothetical protein [Roseivirga sp.]